MSSDINQILYPKILTSLRTTSTSDFEDYAPPVQCIVWKGGEEFETITFDKVYPFDTIEDIKRMICTHYEKDQHFIPKFTFLGVPLYDAAYSNENPTLDTEYLAADYLWYPTDTIDDHTIKIKVQQVARMMFRIEQLHLVPPRPFGS